MRVERRKPKIESFKQKIQEAENFRYGGEFRYITKLQACSKIFSTVHGWLLFPLLYSISSSFEILHSRLAEIDRKPYEIDGNQPDFVMIGLT